MNKTSKISVVQKCTNATISCGEIRHKNYLHTTFSGGIIIPTLRKRGERLNINISGLQKLTLLDFPGKVACTVFTSGCNMRCPFCQNASLVLGHEHESFMSEEEFFKFLDKREGILDGVCLTGGEPLLQKDLLSFMEKIKQKGFTVKLDTNGYMPERLEEALHSGVLDYVAMDIKNSKENYAKTVGVKDLDLTRIERSVELLKNGTVDYEFRTTVVKELHTAEDFKSIAEWLKGAKRYYLQCFSDAGDILESGLSAYSKETLEEFRQILLPSIPHTELRGI